MQTKALSTKFPPVDWRALILCVLLSMLLFAPITYRTIALPIESDHAVHVAVAQNWLETGNLEPGFLSHPLLQVLIICISKLSFGNLGLYASLMILQVLVQGAISAILFLWFPAPSTNKGRFWRFFLSISLPLLAPCMLIAFQDGMYYYGYIGLVNFHNPTIHLLKPFALLAIILVKPAFDGQKKAALLYIVSALTVILSALSKPNFLLVFIPALCLLAGIKFLQKKPLDIPYILFGFVLPSLEILLLQWYIAYASGNSGDAIVFAPLRVITHFSDHLVLKFLLSCLFVLQSSIVLNKQFSSEIPLQLGLLIFIIGMIQTYLLAEDGSRLYHGNFLWSGQIALFLFNAILARSCFVFFCKEKTHLSVAKVSVMLAYFAQVVGGIVYYLHCMLSFDYF